MGTGPGRWPPSPAPPEKPEASASWAAFLKTVVIVTAPIPLVLAPTFGPLPYFGRAIIVAAVGGYMARSEGPMAYRDEMWAETVRAFWATRPEPTTLTVHDHAEFADAVDKLHANEVSRLSKIIIEGEYARTVRETYQKVCAFLTQQAGSTPADVAAGLDLAAAAARMFVSEGDPVAKLVNVVKGAMGMGSRGKFHREALSGHEAADLILELAVNDFFVEGVRDGKVTFALRGS